MGTILRVNAVGALLVAGLFWLLPPDSPVADAAARGDVETVRKCVKRGSASARIAACLHRLNPARRHIQVG